MSFRELLNKYYQADTGEKIILDGREGILSDNMLYFNMNTLNFETVYLEQAVLAYYLFENGYQQVALPIQNNNEEWFTDVGGNRYIIYKVSTRFHPDKSTGFNLAQLHQIGSAYGYEPKTISSYGQWKKLWVEKLTLFEEKIIQYASEQNTDDRCDLIDILPYIIGISENAIQYLRETEESETRFSLMDQGTIAFVRFKQDVDREVIWPDQFVYDHPARDLAEHIRYLFLSGQSDKMLMEFLREYQTERPLSYFSWRLIYARLLFPIHIFDALEGYFATNDIGELKKMVLNQADYEKRLQNFYAKAGIDKERAGLPELAWL